LFAALRTVREDVVGIPVYIVGSCE